MKTKQDVMVLFVYGDKELPMHYEILDVNCGIREVPEDEWIRVFATDKRMARVETMEYYEIPEGQKGTFHQLYEDAEISAWPMAFMGKEKCENSDLYAYYFDGTVA